MILVTYGTLEGTYVCLCRTFPDGQVFMRRFLCSDLHEGFGAQGWVLDPTSGIGL
jgi:hypothetical protein